MSDDQRRTLCRVLFLAVCLVPTLISGYLICHPQTSAGWEQTIKAELGLETRIDFVTTPGPYETWLNHVRFLEGGETLLEVAQIRIVRGSRKNLVQVRWHADEVDQLDLARLLQTLRQRVVGSGGVDQVWQISFDEDLVIDRRPLRMKLPADPAQGLLRAGDFQRQQVALSDLTISLSPTGADAMAVAYFRVGNAGSSSDPDTRPWMEASLAAGPAERMELDTRGGQLPIWLIEGFLPQLSDCVGPAAQFAGSVKLREGESQEARLDGVISDVDSHEYLPDLEPMEPMQIVLDDCQLVDGRVTAWDVRLLSREFMQPIPIDSRHLFVESREIMPRHAIGQAMRQGVQIRYANGRGPIK